MSYCPVSHPYAFFKGKYCCEDERGCDGAYIDYSNNCCKKGNYLNCPSAASCHSAGWCWFTVLILHKDTLNITICLIILCFFIDICCDGLHVQSDGRSADYKFPLLNITMTQDTFGYYYNGFYEDPKYYTRITSAVISGRYSQNIIHRDSLGRWMVCYIYS